MSSLMGSNGLVLATAMVVSAGTVILFDLLREKYLSTIQFELTNNKQEYSPHGKHILKSCLSSGEKKKKKRVHFAANVKDSNGNGEEYRRVFKKYYSKTQSNSCGMPENRRALYTGILKDRVHRMEFSY
ncbi:uncharacterized protein LOC107819186 [Nicotiana tabacum]|uniref:Uncharacterized protein LOC107819186 n=1 Tax=Nicotiana tabacum TaxID=4097 RepID=A0A1S4CHW7_TOBAC|nr:uncharacterized protein LOC104109496 [Nicotiana tomentosiformis]XP_016500763.1 PREDICTED: uncharacterized protein LOC107819186 [Nicotiana tabacum]